MPVSEKHLYQIYHRQHSLGEFHLPFRAGLEQTRQMCLYQLGISCVCAATWMTLLFSSDTSRLQWGLTELTGYYTSTAIMSPLRSKAPCGLFLSPQHTQSCKTLELSLQLFFFWQRWEKKSLLRKWRSERDLNWNGSAVAVLWFRW